MRADRLISILMLLQTHGKMTARELADALEVSERTIYRDVEALCSSGLPLITEHGPGGGLSLLDSYRTNLTGLKGEEIRALFMVLASAGPLEKLGSGQELRSAVMKLSAALPGSRRSDEEKVQQRFFLDWSWWFHEQEPVPHLSTIQQAVWEDRRLRLRYQMYLMVPVDVVVEPYGLVAKAGAWYLVAGVEGVQRVYRISWLSEAALLDEVFERPARFDLAQFWQRWCAEYEDLQQAFPVTLRVSPVLRKVLPLYFGPEVLSRSLQAGAPDEQGWVTLTILFETFEAARGRILSFGRDAEVLDPPALRASVIDFAQQIAAFYAQPEVSGRAG